MSTDDTIRKRDQERLREWFLTLGPPVQSREIRVVLQYLQALDVCDLLTQSAERQAELASAALFRFGLDTDRLLDRMRCHRRVVTRTRRGSHSVKP